MSTKHTARNIAVASLAAASALSLGVAPAMADEPANNPNLDAANAAAPVSRRRPGHGRRARQ